MAPKILIGEIDRSTIGILHDYFVTIGCEIFWAQRGGEVIERYRREHPFDLLLLNTLLPELTGPKIAQRIDAMHRKGEIEGNLPPIFLVSEAYRTFKQNYDQAIPGGVTGFLPSPMSLVALEENVLPNLAGVAARRREGMEEIAEDLFELSGEFSDMPWGEILLTLHRRGAAGALLLFREGEERLVYFEGGAPVHVHASVPEETFGQRLVREKRITRETYHAAIEAMLASSHTLFDLLVKEGAITLPEVPAILARYTKEKLLDVFRWREGRFQFIPFRPSLAPTFSAPLSVASLLVEGVRGRMPIERIRERLLPVEGKKLFVSKTPFFPDAEALLSHREQSILATLAHRHTVEEIEGVIGLPHDQLRQGLYLLMLLGWVRSPALPLGRREEAPSPYSLSLAPPDPQAYARMIETFHETLNRKNYFEILEVTPESEYFDLKIAYHRFARQFRDYDAYMASPPEIRKKADTIFERLTRAYETLSQEERREKYLRTLPPELLERFPARRKKGTVGEGHERETSLPDGDETKTVVAPPPPLEMTRSEKGDPFDFEELEDDVKTVKAPPILEGNAEPEERIEREETPPEGQRGERETSPSALPEALEEGTETVKAQPLPQTAIDDAEMTVKGEAPANVHSDDRAPLEEDTQGTQREEELGALPSEEVVLPHGEASPPRSLEDTLSVPEELLLAGLASASSSTLSLEETGAQIEKDLLVEICLQEGMEHLEKGDYAGALGAFEEASRLRPDDPRITAHRAWAKFKAADRLDPQGADAAREEGKRLLEETIEKEPSCAQAYLYLGMLTLGEGEIERARNYLEMALRYDPDCTKAREILEHMAV